jgi:hypothetical protein
VAVRGLAVLPTATPSLRLLVDDAAEALLGLSRVLEGLILLADPAHPVRIPRDVRPPLADLLPVAIAATRVVATILAATLLWIATAWLTEQRG